MGLEVFAIICLVVGISSGEILTQINGKKILLNDESEKDLPARKLLYVVGVYPEWEKQIVNFKKKWGEKGEKYLEQPNVYIHGDIEDLQSTVAKVKESNIPETTDQSTEMQARKASENKINDPIQDETEKSDKINSTDTRRNYLARRQKEYQEFLEDKLKEDSIPNNPDKENINNENYRKYTNIDRMYGRILGRRFLGGDTSDDLSDTLANKPVNTNFIAPYNWQANQENEELIKKDNINSKRNYIPTSIIHNTYTRPQQNFMNNNAVPQFTNNQQNEELRWLKQVLIPRIINGNRYPQQQLDDIKIVANLGDDNNLPPLKKIYPTLNLRRNNIKKKLNENTNDTDEKKEKKNLNSKLVDSRELIKQRLSNRKLKIGKGISNTKLEDTNEDPYRRK